MSRWRPEPRVLHLPACDEPVAALARALDARPLARGTRVACVLPGRFARNVLVPWDALPPRAAGRQAVAEACFREVYGELARPWRVRVDAPRFGRPALACAVDGALLDALCAATAERGLALRSVQPAAAVAVNALRDELAEDGGAASWVVVPEPPALTLLLVEDGAVQHVKVVAGAAVDAEAIVAREWFALGRDAAAARVRVAPLPAAAGEA